MAIGEANGLRDLKAQVHPGARQLATDGRGLFIVKAECDKYATVTQQVGGEVFLPNGPKKRNAGQPKQTPCCRRPRAGSRPAKVIATDDNGVGIARFEKLDVSNEFGNIAVGLDAMNANHPHSSRYVACGSPNLGGLARAGRAGD